jgi:alpha-amylase/alpha-mannosidase (GH57 family)
MGTPRYVCIHGHFYQPPRENPWLEAVEVQDSAHPYHDWNERITRECYAPNGRSRLIDGCGMIVNLLNNYAWISFNFGPTLLAWMEEAAPEVLAAIVQGDRISRERCGGHGNALAQSYNHVIMPLASARDRQTQVLWGIADFRHRFGREPEGMWLPETAADTATLEVLAEQEIRFTILAPRQARRWRAVGETDWIETGGIDPSRPYLCRLPSGRSISLFFYDGIVSQQVAFERILDRGEEFLRRLMNGFDDEREHAELMHIATDGESYGHHHPFGDMALAYVLDRLRHDPEVRLTNYGEYLENHPPEWEVEIHDNSSWSCVHGVERWRADCGCRGRGDWQQAWRGPFRQALDWLKGRLDSLFSTRGRACFPDPWAARDAYVSVVLDRSPENVWAFFRRHGHPDLDELLVGEGLALLEMQRHAMLMFTSCGWFFDEISGLETTQCLRYAARALQLARHFNLDFEEDLVRRLEKAPSNLPHFKDGRGVWEQLISPWQADLERVLAHHALSLLYLPDQAQTQTRVYCYDLESLDQQVHARAGNRVAVGRLRARSRTTWDSAESSFVVIHYGGLDFYTVLRKGGSLKEYEEFKNRLLEVHRSSSLADVTALVLREFEGEVHRLDDLFAEEQRRVIGIVLRDRFEEYQRLFERLADQDEDVLNRLGQLRYPVPKPLRAAASAHIDSHLLEEIEGLRANGNLSRLRALLERGRPWGYEPERGLLSKTLGEALQQVLRELGPEDSMGPLARAANLLEAATLLGVRPDLWRAQNQLLDAYARLSRGGTIDARLHQSLLVLADRLGTSPGLLECQQE